MMVRPRAQALCAEAGGAGLSAQRWKESKEGQPADSGREGTEMMGPGFYSNTWWEEGRESVTEPGCKAGCREKLIKTN